MFDMIIVGGGPAGLTAAVYGRRNGRSVLVIEKSVFGGQIVNTPNVENIPGFAAIGGDEFADKLLDQAIGQGAEVALENVISAEKENNVFVVKTEEGSVYEGRTLILATGTTHRVLGLPGEEGIRAAAPALPLLLPCEPLFFLSLLFQPRGLLAFAALPVEALLPAPLPLLRPDCLFPLPGLAVPAQTVVVHPPLAYGDPVLALGEKRCLIPSGLPAGKQALPSRKPVLSRLGCEEQGKQGIEGDSEG